MTEVKVSIVVPVYNAAEFVRETIDSVLTQTFKDFELLLMDDGSTDNTADIIGTYNDSRIVYEFCPHNYVTTINKGFDKAKGKYVALFDHDDVMVPQRLQIQYDYMEAHPDIAACGGSMREFGVSSYLLMSVPKYEEIILEMLARKRRYICNPCGFLRKDIIDRYSLRYKQGYSFNADIKYWSDVLQVGKVVNLPDVLVWYRTSDKQTSVVTRIESQKAAEAIFQEHADFFISRVMDIDMRNKLENRLMPVLKKLTELSVFSNRRYFFFLYELVNGLYCNGFINLSEPLYELKPRVNTHNKNEKNNQTIG